MEINNSVKLHEVDLPNGYLTDLPRADSKMSIENQSEKFGTWVEVYDKFAKLYTEQSLI